MIQSPRRRANFAVTFLVLFFVAGWSSAQLPSPQQFFGFRLGTDRQLVDYDQLMAYFRVLAEASPRIRLHVIGATTEGNPFLVAVISSAANLRREAYYRGVQAKLADARVTPPEEAARLIAEGRGIASINCSIHPSEVGASQMAPELAFELLTDESPAVKLVRNEVILLLIPAHNPDGLNMVARWYRAQLGTPYEGTLPPWLYHRYTGHDLNRDWFMLTQAETGLTVDSVYNAWRPHVVLDMHQMGSNGARLFLPPYIDPIDPNVDPVLQAATSMLGTHVAADLTGQGFAGVIIHSDFDAYTPARAYPNYHGGIRFLSETASCRVASPVTVRREELSGRAGQDLLTRRWNLPLPWTGGRWSLREVVDYDKAVAWSVLQHVARNRELWLRNAYAVAQNALRGRDDLSAFVVPRQQHDPSATIQMLRILRRGLVEVFEAGRAFRAAGRLYEAGTFVIPLAQPYGAYARTLLEARKYEVPRAHPQLPPAEPYDVTAHQLPLLMGVRVEKISGPLPPDLELRPAALALQGGMQGQSPVELYALSPTEDRAFAVVNFALAHGATGQWAQESFIAGGRTWPAGTFLLEGGVPLGALDSVAAAVGVTVVAMDGVPSVATKTLRRPRVGVYQSYAGTADEGWLRWVLERDGFHYRVLHNTDVQAGRLGEQFDALILPSMGERMLLEGLSAERYPAAYSGGLGETGTMKLREFVEQGGTLLALGSSSALPLRHFALPVRNVLAGGASSTFRCPGSLLRAQCDQSHPLSFGLPAEVALFVSEKIAFSPRSGSSPITFAADSLLLSGWLEGQRLIAQQAALVVCPLGKGKVVLFGFRPHFRAWTVGTFKVLFNALYWSAAE
ncbi:MAG: M14 family metallopeptidase [Candidatus Oleimicrobiaceae bacterium]